MLKEIRKYYNIRSIKYGGHPNLDYAYGVCNYTDGIIYLHSKLKKDPDIAVKVVLHEVGHIFCYRNDIWKNYHINKKRLTRQDKNKIIRIGLKAERWIENWAEKELKKWRPDLVYVKHYYTTEKEKLYKERYLSQFR
jgi:hypothetical protein